MKPRRFYESARTPEITAIVREGRYAQMLVYLMSLAERAALAAERAALEAARTKAKEKRKTKKVRRARRKAID